MNGGINPGTIFVIAVIAVLAFFSARAGIKSMKRAVRGEGCSGCGCSGSCAHCQSGKKLNGIDTGYAAGNEGKILKVETGRDALQAEIGGDRIKTEDSGNVPEHGADEDDLYSCPHCRAAKALAEQLRTDRVQ